MASTKGTQCLMLYYLGLRKVLITLRFCPLMGLWSALHSVKQIPWSHRWASTSTSISAISDIRHRYLLFRYRKKICRTENCHSDIGRVPISTSESIPISDIQKIFITSAGFEPKTLVFSATVLIYEFLDVGYRISDKSLFRYPIYCRTPLSSVRYRKFRYQAQSDIADHGYRSKCPPMHGAHTKDAKSIRGILH
jgi:hypothetical protein